MQKRDWFIVLAALTITLLIDQASKVWALEVLKEPNFWGPFGLVLYFNKGAMLGLFSDLPAVLRVVSLSTGGAFLVFCFIVIQYLLPIKSMNLRVGMAILLGGILGNVVDRVIYGHVVDFLVVKTPWFASGIFNLADAVQWIAYAMIVRSLIRESEILWPENERRGRLWIDPSFQWRYCLTLVFAGLAFSLISGVFSYTFLRVSLEELLGKQSLLVAHYLTPFTLTFVILSLSFGMLMFLLGRKLSHRTVGPVHAFDKFLDDLLGGKARRLKLRVGDEFPHLEKMAEKLSQKFNVSVENAPLESEELSPQLKVSAD